MLDDKFVLKLSREAAKLLSVYCSKDAVIHGYSRTIRLTVLVYLLSEFLSANPNILAEDVLSKQLSNITKQELYCLGIVALMYSSGRMDKDSKTYTDKGSQKNYAVKSYGYCKAYLLNTIQLDESLAERYASMILQIEVIPSEKRYRGDDLLVFLLHSATLLETFSDSHQKEISLNAIPLYNRASADTKPFVYDFIVQYLVFIKKQQSEMMRVQFAEADCQHGLMNTALVASSRVSRISKLKNEHFDVQSVFLGIFDEMKKWYAKQTQPEISHSDAASLIKEIKTNETALITRTPVITNFLEKTKVLAEEANSVIDRLNTGGYLALATAQPLEPIVIAWVVKYLLEQKKALGKSQKVNRLVAAGIKKELADIFTIGEYIPSSNASLTDKANFSPDYRQVGDDAIALSASSYAESATAPRSFENVTSFLFQGTSSALFTENRIKFNNILKRILITHFHWTEALADSFVVELFGKVERYKAKASLLGKVLQILYFKDPGADLEARAEISKNIIHTLPFGWRPPSKIDVSMDVVECIKAKNVKDQFRINAQAVEGVHWCKSIFLYGVDRDYLLSLKSAIKGLVSAVHQSALVEPLLIEQEISAQLKGFDMDIHANHASLYSLIDSSVLSRWYTVRDTSELVLFLLKLLPEGASSPALEQSAKELLQKIMCDQEHVESLTQQALDALLPQFKLMMEEKSNLPSRAYAWKQLYSDLIPLLSANPIMFSFYAPNHHRWGSNEIGLSRTDSHDKKGLTLRWNDDFSQTIIVQHADQERLGASLFKKLSLMKEGKLPSKALVDSEVNQIVLKTKYLESRAMGFTTFAWQGNFLPRDILKLFKLYHNQRQPVVDLMKAKSRGDRSNWPNSINLSGYKPILREGGVTASPAEVLSYCINTIPDLPDKGTEKKYRDLFDLMLGNSLTGDQSIFSTFCDYYNPTANNNEPFIGQFSEFLLTYVEYQQRCLYATLKFFKDINASLSARPEEIVVNDTGLSEFYLSFVDEPHACLATVNLGWIQKDSTLFGLLRRTLEQSSCDPWLEFEAQLKTVFKDQVDYQWDKETKHYGIIENLISLRQLVCDHFVIESNSVESFKAEYESCDEEGRSVLFDSMSTRLPELISTIQDYITIALLLNKTQCTVFFQMMRSKRMLLTKNPEDFGNLLKGLPQEKCLMLVQVIAEGAIARTGLERVWGALPEECFDDGSGAALLHVAQFLEGYLNIPPVLKQTLFSLSNTKSMTEVTRLVEEIKNGNIVDVETLKGKLHQLLFSAADLNPRGVLLTRIGFVLAKLESLEALEPSHRAGPFSMR